MHSNREIAPWLGRVAALAFGLLLAGAGPALAQQEQDADRQAAEEKAEAFMEGIGDDRCTDLYRQLGKRMRDYQGEEGFVAQCSLVRSQTGGQGRGRRVVDFRRMQQLPGPEGMVFGEFTFVRFASRYPAGPVYEDVYLEKEADDDWRVVGWWLNPAPG